MAIEQRADYSAVQHARKRLVMRLGVPGRNHLVAFRKTANVQTLLIFYTAAETDALWGVFFLQR